MRGLKKLSNGIKRAWPAEQRKQRKVLVSALLLMYGLIHPVEQQSAVVVESKQRTEEEAIGVVGLVLQLHLAIGEVQDAAMADAHCVCGHTGDVASPNA